MSDNAKLSQWFKRLDVSNLTDDEAVSLLALIEQHKGWAVRVVTRADAASAYEGSDAEGDLSDEEWSALRRSQPWRSLGEMESEDWGAVHQAVYNTLGSVDERAASRRTDEFCDNCGERLRRDRKGVHVYSELPRNVASANKGESGVLCGVCNEDVTNTAAR